MAKNLPGSIPSQTLGVLGDIFGKTAKGVFTHDELALFAKRRNPFPVATERSSKRRGKKKTIYPDSLPRLLDLWVTFWQVVGSRDLTDADLALPAYQVGFDWPVVAPGDMTAQQLYDLTESAKFFPCWKNWGTLDELQVAEDYLKATAEASVVLIRPSVEADTKLSYNQAVVQRLVFLGLRHRLILEPFGFWLNKDHLAEAQALKIPSHFDPIGWTRTSSLDPDGGVAGGLWGADYGGFGVRWSDRDDADPNGGIRQAVS